MNFASWGPLGRALGGLLGRRGAILGVLERYYGVLELCWTILRASWGSLSSSRGSWEALRAAPRSKTIPDRELHRELLRVLFVRGPPGAAPRARTRKLLSSYRRS